jgi:glucuronate isomerase
LIPLRLHPDRLFLSDPSQRDLARRLYASVNDLPIVSPHGHTDPQWYADNQPFTNASALLITPDHYVFRMLYSQGIKLEDLAIPRRDGGPVEQDARKIWRVFAAHYHLFRGTPTRVWLDHAFHEVFGVRERLTSESADRIFDPLSHHAKLRESGWKGRVITAYRPDPTVDPEFDGFAANVEKLGQLTGEDSLRWNGYLAAHRNRRAFFKTMGATSTDHGHPTAQTSDLSDNECEALWTKAIKGKISAAEAEMFRGQMLTEMAKMSLDDGLVMQIHPGSFRNHNPQVYQRFGRDKGADIPTRTDYVHALKPLLDRFGNERDLTLILFTLDETAYSRELAPLAGHYPILRLGPPWWFYDSPEGMLRFREQTTETAGFYNTVGFNDDTRAFLSIPARHDVARRMDCRFLAQLVAEHKIEEDEAFELAPELAYGLAKRAYKL